MSKIQITKLSKKLGICSATLKELLRAVGIPTILYGRNILVEEDLIKPEIINKLKMECNPNIKRTCILRVSCILKSIEKFKIYFSPKTEESNHKPQQLTLPVNITEDEVTEILKQLKCNNDLLREILAKLGN